MSLALALVLEIVHITLLVENLHIGSDGGVGGLGLFIALEDVPCASRVVDVPKDGHDLKLDLGQRIVFFRHSIVCVILSFIRGSLPHCTSKVKASYANSNRFDIENFRICTAFNIY